MVDGRILPKPVDDGSVRWSFAYRWAAGRSKQSEGLQKGGDMDAIDGSFVAQLFFLAAGISAGVRVTEDLFAWKARRAARAVEAD